MPRIDFQPPLATTTTVHLPPTGVFISAKDPRVTLSFIARPIDGLAEDDIVEIWTDGGTSRSWRAIPFERDGEDRDLVARISVDMVEGSFGFTYRVTHASGDATWLGDMGGNGKIDLAPSEGEDALWKGEDWLRFVDGWTGFGVHVDEAGLAIGIKLEESVNLSFAYLHPSASTAPFATFHPTASVTIRSTAFGLLSTTGTTLACTDTSLTPITQSAEFVPSTGPPAAYASYCGLGFSGGEQERTKAFRSLLGFAQHHLQYIPCVERGKGKDVHAVGLLASDGEVGKPNRLITYLAGGPEAEWDLSSVSQGESGMALWNSESRHAHLASKTLRMTSNSPAVQTLQIVNLFDLSSDGSILIGILDDTNPQWIFSPKRTETEEILVDEVVSSPAQQGKALGETSDSGETVESSGVPSSLDFTSDADNETLGTSVDDVDGETVGKGTNADVEEPGPAPEAEVTDESTASAHSEPEQPPINEPTATPAPKRSILRFFWITISFLNSLWWGTVSWFRQWISRKPAGTIAAEDQPSPEEQAPIIREVDPANYASMDVQPDITEPEVPAKDPTAPPVESDIETLRVPETRTIFYPAHISAIVSCDVLLLTNASVTSLVGEIKNVKTDDWQFMRFVQEDIAPTSEMKMVRLPVSSEAEVRVHLA